MHDQRDEKQVDESTRVRDDADRASQGRHLLIITPEEIRTYAMLGSGPITIGRSERSLVCIPDDLLSRDHAQIHLQPELAVEDLGSVNGTVVGAGRIDPRVRVPLRVGQPVLLGSAVIIVQPSTSPATRRSFESHGAFEGHLRSACASAGRDGMFAVLRVLVTGEASSEDVRDAIGAEIGPSDTMAIFAPGEVEVLLGSVDAQAAEDVAGRIEERLTGLGFTGVVGTASYPVDGRTADALLACASPRAPDANEPIFASDEMRDLVALIDRLAQGNIGVLILGETGVGKEVIAEIIHRRSPRRAGPFVRINCAALPDSLIESELFGHNKSAFTGATTDRVGLLEASKGGTIFLDEIGEMPLSQQATLLRAVERREITRIGSTQPVPIDVRFVTATNRDLFQEVEERRFRRDLLFRLAGAVVHVPPLRARQLDIGPLADRFIRELSRDLSRPPPRFSPAAAALLREYPWPGNVRELKNAIERALLLARGATIDVEHLPLDKMHAGWSPAAPLGAPPAPRDELEPGEREERARMVEALRAHLGNQTRAAASLGVPRRTFTHRMKRFGLQRERADWLRQI